MLMTDEQIEQVDEWVNLSEASRRIGVSKAKLSKMVKQGRITSRSNPYNDREVLMNMKQLRVIFPPREKGM